MSVAAGTPSKEQLLADYQEHLSTCPRRHTFREWLASNHPGVPDPSATRGEPLDQKKYREAARAKMARARVSSLFFPDTFFKRGGAKVEDTDQAKEWLRDYQDYVQYPRFTRDSRGKLALDPWRESHQGWLLRGRGGAGIPMTEPKNIFGQPSHRKYLKILNKGTGWDDRPRKILPYQGRQVEEFNLPNPFLRP